ncbi:hypothetical protein K3X13_00700 [Aliiroseovarius crassostreae]|uniref:Uncharacterized protein n=1 Tax=Aliiroseovarius crassostreae TaxID=154981 RepID=A0A9Q9LTS9_9RHOB|nr:DUF6173 family protein [Aliiroseovarius crassostreae]UWP89287.1 hypothetical protein K3J57_00805 [Aliiroseovarius crassostreae]UWP92421.1 hypothetical protein K3X13_00700 [Aliiroseovarius crassostreae]UWP95565.1 hypothetical protein K3X48_00700 [Aliiroseovarius crassostreae]UWQ01931.1 hypothetical protein K3X44_00810 [Aliiroseovarius crassostreae]
MTKAPNTKPRFQPRKHAAKCSEDAPVVVEDQPLPEKMAATPVEQKSAAQWAYERLILYIKNFEEQLDNEHEVAMGFTGGDAGVLRIEGIGFFDPDVITFYGTDQSGARTQLIQHVSQLSVMLRALPVAVEAEAPKRIGFRLAAELEDSQDEDPEDGSEEG